MTVRKNKYSDLEIINSAKSFIHKIDWVKSCPNMYAIACRRNLIGQATAHMKPKQESHTKESCRIAALKCRSREEFKKLFRREYASAHHNGWFEDIVKHMPKQAQTIYDSPESVIQAIETNKYKQYKNLPAGLVSKAKKFGILPQVKSMVTCGIQEEQKYRKLPSPSRPKDINGWKLIISQFGLSVISNKIEISKSHKSERAYESIELKCSKYFKNTAKPHPSFIRRLTNIERDIKMNRLNCPYCIKPNLISPIGDKNRENDIVRLNENLLTWANKNDLLLAPNQNFLSANNKYLFIEKETQIHRSILAKNILTGKSLNPFRKGQILSDRFKTRYEDVVRICKQKNFHLITTREDFDKITKYNNDAYSPITRRIKFTWFENEYEYPINSVIKPHWFPQDSFISEEVVRYAIQKFFKFKFIFKKSKPKNLKNNAGYKLELDGYCENVFGKGVAFEHQGKQHYSEKWNGKGLGNITENDKLKRQWCKENNIILFEIKELGNVTQLTDLPHIFYQNLIQNGIILNDDQFNSKINIEEVNQFIGNKIPKRMKAVERWLDNHKINISFLGIDKQMRLFVKITNKNHYTRKIPLSTLEKWTIDKIIQFNNRTSAARSRAARALSSS